MNNDPDHVVDHRELAPVAALLGRLLLHEIDADTLAELASLRVELQDLGITLPTPVELDEIAHQYFVVFVAPAAGRPPVQSLWSEDRYDGEPALQVRALAAAVGFESGPGARGAPADHLGCILMLWAAAVEAGNGDARDGDARDGDADADDIAQRLLAGHLAWALPVCARVAAQGGFYGEVAIAVGALLRELLPA